MKPIVDTLKTIAGKLSAATATVTDEIVKLRATITETRRELARVQTSLVTLKEVDGRIADYVAQTGAYALKEHGQALLYVLAHPAPNGVDLRAFRESVPWPIICAVEPDRAKAILSAFVRQVPYEAGPPLPDRPAHIARLTRELAELEAAEEQFVDESCAAGVVIAHRPEVVERRIQEARQAAINADRAARLQPQQAAVDAAHARRFERFGESEYLRSGRLPER